MLGLKGVAEGYRVRYHHLYPAARHRRHVAGRRIAENPLRHAREPYGFDSSTTGVIVSGYFVEFVVGTYDGLRQIRRF
jgi:hypothetical protein